MSEQETELQEQKVPTREEMIKFYTDQIELKQLQVQLQELNTAFLKAKSEEIQITAFIGEMMSARPDEDGEEEEDNTPLQQPQERKLKTDGNV